MKYTKTVLKNGLRIITIPMKESQTAIMMILVKAGLEYEDKRINGISHFVEHMCFKGTKQRTGEQISEELDSLGAYNNAFTGETFTGYYAKAQYKKIDKLIDIISDMYINPAFPKKDIETERGVIIEEMNMYKDDYLERAAELLNKIMYPNQLAGEAIIGTTKTLNSIKQQDFFDYYNKHYVPSKTVVVVAGNIDPKKIQKQIQNIFSHLKKSPSVKKSKTQWTQTKPVLKISNEKIDQTHLQIGFRSFDLYKKNKIAPLAIAGVILGGSRSSHLYRKMREELGVCYYISSSNQKSLDHGVFAIRSGVTNSRTGEVIKVILEETKKLRDEEISSAELKKAKDIILGNFANGVETSEDWASYYGFQELRDLEIESPKEFEKRIRAVTPKDVQKVLKQIIRPERLSVAIVGPHKNSSDFRKLLKI